jgi:hypothetical protein
MKQFPPSEDDSPPPQVRFQFGPGRLLLLTFCCALVAAWASSLKPAPILFQLILVFYGMALTAYVVLRVPHRCRGIMRRTPRWDRLREQRAQLESMIAQARAAATNEDHVVSKQAQGDATDREPHET